MTSIGWGAFHRCHNLTSVIIPENVDLIEGYVFADCYSLTEINVSDDNENYISIDGVLFNRQKKELIAYPAGKSQNEYTVPNEVLSIVAFAFSGSYNLQRVCISDNVQNISELAFDSCVNMTEISVSEGNEYYKTEDGVLFDNQMTDLIYYPINKDNGSYKIPYGVERIGHEAFTDCDHLENIELPDSIMSIGCSVFMDCNSLKNINIPAGVTNIEDNTFYNCGSLSEVTIPASVTQISWYAFGNCGSLKTVNYGGNERRWGDISIEDGNEYLLSANKIFNEDDDYTGTDEHSTIEEFNDAFSSLTEDSDKDEVVSAADVYTKLSDEAQESVSLEDVEKIETLLKNVLNITESVSGDSGDSITVSGLVLAAGSDNWNENASITLICDEVIDKHDENSEYELDLAMSVNGARVQPQAPVIISVQASENLRKAGESGGVRVWHYTDSGERESVDCDIIDGKLVFRAAGFSRYVITEALNLNGSGSVYIPSYLDGKSFKLICSGYDAKGKMIECIVKDDVTAGGSVDLTWKKSGMSSYKAFALTDVSFIPLTEPASAA